jgi:glycosyltransferase involved in cell wall biosynthesis
MRTIHFIYTVPRGDTLTRRIIDRAIAMLRIIPPLHRWGIDMLIPWRTPIRAPHSISYHLLHALKAYGREAGYRVRFYSMYEKGVCPMKEGDILIATPKQKGSLGTPTDSPDHDSITWRTLEAYPRHKKYIIMPYANDVQLVSWCKELMQKHGEHVIFLAGKIWMDQWDRSPLRDTGIKNILRLDMGIDLAEYPMVKTHFNPKGKRKYLYIGHTAWYKNTAELEHIAAMMPDFEGGHIGNGTIRGWKKIADFADLTPAFMERIAKEYDIFVNTSTGDAQVTTVLEQMCFGFAVACTPESGYAYPSLFKLSTHDTAENIRVLTMIQTMDEQELLARAKENREIARTTHSWKRFCDQVIDFIKK